MLLWTVILIICQFFISGMLTSAILINRAENRHSHWNLYACAVLCFMFGLYYIIALIGAAGKL